MDINLWMSMLAGKRIVVIMPAYNAELTLERTYAEMPHDIVDHVIIVDDCSSDGTVAVASRLGLEVLRHDRNRGYGANQKTCYRRALAVGADVVVMLHPDYQYTPKLMRGMVSLIVEGLYDVVIGSRILGKGALLGGMPLYKYFFNRILTLIQNVVMGQKLSEYHTGYRAFSRRVLETVAFDGNSDDFVFDNQMLAQCLAFDFRLGEISCPTKYFPEASSINFKRSVVYGLGCLRTALQYRLAKLGVRRSAMFERRVGTSSVETRGEDLRESA